MNRFFKPKNLFLTGLLSFCVGLIFIFVLPNSASGATLNSYVLGTGQIRMEQALALNSVGNPAVVYRDSKGENILFCQFDGTSWLPPEVVAQGNSPSLVFKDNIPHIGYCGPTGDARYTTRIKGYWQNCHVEDNAYNVSIAIKGETPCLTYRYHDGSAVRFAYLENGKWNIETIPVLKMVSQGGALGINSLGDIFIAGHKDGAFAVFKSSSWNSQFIEPWPEYTASFSPAYDQIGIPCVSYWRRNVSLKKESGDLRFAKYVDKKWQIETAIHSEFPGGDWDCGYTSLIFDNKNRPWISYTVADGQDIFTGLFILHKKRKKWIKEFLTNEPPNAISMAYSPQNDEIWIAVSTRKDNEIIIFHLRNIDKNEK